MAQKITVIGTGYVGLVSAVGLSDFGNHVIGVDIDPIKVATLNQGTSTIYEHGIEDYLRRNQEAGRLRFTGDIEWAIRQSDIIFLAVGTPPDDDGGADLSQIWTVVDHIKAVIQNDQGRAGPPTEGDPPAKIVVTKSTVPVGTNRKIALRLGGAGCRVVSNPEFLREGKAVQDFFHPDRIVIGTDSDHAHKLLADIYRPLYLIQTPFVWCNWETAELIKYASNAFLATKITYINQMANLAETVGADINAIAKSMGMDGRISPKFLHPGPGYGGSCFPKDTRAVAHTGDIYGVDMGLIKAVIQANEKQKFHMVQKLERLLGDLTQKKIAVLGLAFKSETDDVRESPAITITRTLLKRGAQVRVHDVKALKNFEKIFDSAIAYFDKALDAVKGADAVLILTEWNEYRDIDLAAVKSLTRSPVILDARNVLDKEKVLELGFAYQGVGR